MAMLRVLLMLPVRLGISTLDVALGIFLSTFSRVFNQFLAAITVWANCCKNTAVAMATVIITFHVLFCVSIFIYWSFYNVCIPIASHIKDTNFIFNSKCEMRGPCNFPSANVSLGSGGQRGLLRRSQQYTISLELNMPESPANTELGMFMVRLDLYTKHSEVVWSAQRAAMLRYKSKLRWIAETVVLLPLLLYDFSEQKQTVRVVLFTNFVEDAYKPVLGAYMELETRFIELYKAFLVIEARFTGLRYLLFTWPVTSAVVGVAFITSFLSLTALLSWYVVSAVPELTVSPFTSSIPFPLTHPETQHSGMLPARGEFEMVENVFNKKKDMEDVQDALDAIL